MRQIISIIWSLIRFERLVRERRNRAATSCQRLSFLCCFLKRSLINILSQSQLIATSLRKNKIAFKIWFLLVSICDKVLGIAFQNVGKRYWRKMDILRYIIYISLIFSLHPVARILSNCQADAPSNSVSPTIQHTHTWWLAGPTILPHAASWMQLPAKSIVHICRVSAFWLWLKNFWGVCSSSSLDRKFRPFKAWKSDDPWVLWSSKASIDRFEAFDYLNCLIGFFYQVLVWDVADGGLLIAPPDRTFKNIEP